MKKKLLLALLLLLLSLFLAACAPALEPNYKKGDYISGRTLNESSAAEQDTGLTINVKTDNQPVGILLRGILTQGQVFISLKDQVGSIAWSSDPVGGSLSQNRLVNALKAGQYHLFMAWNGPVQGQLDVFSLVGEALRLPEVSPLGLLSGVGMLLVAAGYIYFAARRRRGWKVMGLGALVWLAAVLIKITLAAQLNGPFYRILVGTAAPLSLPGLFYDLYVGLQTGLFEVLLVWLFVVWNHRLDKTSWKNALAFGLGFGAFEALVLGLGSLAGMSFSLLNTNSLSLAALESLSQTASLLINLAPISERFFTTLVHIFSGLLIFYAAFRGKQGWMWLAFVYKTLFDAVAAYAQISGILGSTRGVWMVELIFMLFGLAGWYGISRLLPLYQTPMSLPGKPASARKGKAVV